MKKYNNGEFRKENIGEEVTAYGWVHRVRNIGSLIFVDLRDRTGLLQVVFNEDHTNDMDIASTLKNEYCIKVEGYIDARSQINPNMPTGEVELIAKKIEILSESEVLPFNVNDDKEVSETVALKYRYLDLRRDKLKNILLMRSRICAAARNYLSSNGFIEVETPMLCRSTPEGARDYVVPSRIQNGTFYALPQSPQLYKQLLMIGGIERYYQIAKCFRDEDLRADRQPEFTQIDIEMSFATKEDVWEMAEGMIKKIVKEVRNVELPDFPKIKYFDAMDKYGSDKPDTRFEMLLENITSCLKETTLSIFSAPINDGGVAKCIVAKDAADKYSRKDIDGLSELIKKYGAHGLAWYKYENNEFTGGISRSLETENLEKINKLLNIENNDIVFMIVDKEKVVNSALGALRINVARNLNLIDEDKLNFLWVIDFPMFEWSDTENRYMAAHHPFTMPESLEMLDDKEHCLAQSYDIVVNGYELASGSVRIHDAKMQKIVFEKLGISDEEIKRKFGFFVDAFKFGAPPHAGIAPGLDRLTMILAKTDNVKDVIAFPKVQNASDLMTEAPNIIDEKQLKELGISINKRKEE